MGRLWLLRLTPRMRHAGWISGGLILAVLLGVYGWAGALLTEQGVNSNWDAALFFCVILAYIVPIMSFIVRHAEAALDQLRPHLQLSAEQIDQRRRALSEKSWRWVAVNTTTGVGMWLLQGVLLFGGWQGMLAMLITDRLSLLMAVGPLLVWVCVTCAIHVLVDNAVLFRRLVPAIAVDLLDPQRFIAFGRMAVSSTLVVIGAQASFVILWLGDATDPWTTIPGIAATSIALVFLFVLPTWPAHRALRACKHRVLEGLQQQITVTHQQVGAQRAYDQVAPLLVFRREIAEASEWPFDLSVVARFSLYLVIVPLTWIGAALIEKVVDLFVA